ncbi:MAG: hypothetical protein AABY22_07810, partial [Nanoarchaeota archaeon]
MKRKPYVQSDVNTLSIREAKGIAGVSRTTLCNWISEDRFNYERQINRYVLIDKTTFMRFI